MNLKEQYWKYSLIGLILGTGTVIFIKLIHIVSLLPKVAQWLMEGSTSFAINVLVLLFVLYFMLVGGPRMESYLASILPFNQENKRRILHEVTLIVKSNAIGIGLSLFGFMGVIFGPLMLELFILCVNIFKVQYLAQKPAA